jgi:hypothetical protein
MRLVLRLGLVLTPILVVIPGFLLPAIWPSAPSVHPFVNEAAGSEGEEFVIVRLRNKFFDPPVVCTPM